MDDQVRLTVNISGGCYDALSVLSSIRNETMSEALRRAISTALFLMKERARGVEVLLRDLDGNLRAMLP